jgi:hypothetical protein
MGILKVSSKYDNQDKFWRIKVIFKRTLPSTFLWNGKKTLVGRIK